MLRVKVIAKSYFTTRNDGVASESYPFGCQLLRWTADIVPEEAILYSGICIFSKIFGVILIFNLRDDCKSWERVKAAFLSIAHGCPTTIFYSKTSVGIVLY